MAHSTHETEEREFRNDSDRISAEQSSAGRTEQIAMPSHDEAAMNPSKRFPFWIWLGTICVSFVAGKYLVLGHSEGHSKVDLIADATIASTGEEVFVTTQFTELHPVQRKIQAVGTLHGFEEVVVSSKVEGRVTRIYHDLASQVKPGDLLLELDAVDAELAVQQAEKMLQTELSKWGFSSVPEQNADVTNLPSVVSARLRYEHAASRLRRMQPLQATNSISIDDMEQIQSDAKILESEWRNQLLQANSAVATARLRAADLAIAKQRLADCKIYVPIPSISGNQEEEYYSITERLVSEGTLLRPGTEVFRMVLGRSLKLRLAVPEINAGKIRVGQSVEVHVASTTEPQPGTVSKISPAIDRNSRTFLVEVVLPNTNGVCKPGGFAKADVFIEGNAHALMVPSESVYSLAGNHKIFLLQDGVAKEFLVTLGVQNGNWVEIATPEIPVGAKVVTSGQRLLSEGLPVTERSSAPKNTESSNTESSNTESLNTESLNEEGSNISPPQSDSTSQDNVESIGSHQASQMLKQVAERAQLVMSTSDQGGV